MKTTVRFLNLEIHNSWHRVVEQHLDHWRRLTAVHATEVVIERQYVGRPAIRVEARLQVAGGSLHAEATARALRPALAETTRDLERQIQDRQTRRLDRRAGERQGGIAADHPVYQS